LNERNAGADSPLTPACPQSEKQADMSSNGHERKPGSFTLVLPLMLLAVLLLVITASAPAQEELEQFQGIVHVHSDVSSGKLAIPDLVKLARDNNIRIIFLTDHLLMKISYGLPVFPNLLKITRTRPSVISLGPENYLQRIAEARSSYPDMVLVPGVEAAPLYHWEGGLLNKNLKVVDWRRHLLVLGSEDPEFYAGMPVVHNMKKKFRWNERKNIRALYLFFIPLVIGLLMLRWGGPYRAIGIVVIILSLMAVVNFALGPGAPYSTRGDAGAAPYQRVIDYAGEHGALVFWAHPESNLTTSNLETPLGPIAFETPPHPESLTSTGNYDGFEAMYRDVRHLTDPGKGWDQVLMEYTGGERKKPAWGIAGEDFHGSTDGSEDIAEVITVFMLHKLSREAALEAIRKGRVYSLWRTKEYRLILNTFRVRDVKSRISGLSGDRIKVKGPPVVEVKITASDGSKRKLTVSLVRSGKGIERFKGSTPFKLRFVDNREKPGGGMLYYRIDVKGPEPHRIISNPIFVETESGS